MNLFKKTKTTDEKFEENKKRDAILLLLRVYRDDKFKLPHTDAGDKLLEICNRIDPDKKLSEEQLLDAITADDSAQEFLRMLNMDTVLPDDVLKAYAEKYYESLLGVLQSPDPKAWDTHEFQSQQLVSVLSLKNFERFKAYLKESMDADPKCPYFIKSKLLDLLNPPKSLPTKEDEKIAEKIMSLVCVGLRKSEPEVFRALVDSLKWRGADYLQKTLAAVERTPPEKRKLKGRESCVFIETEETVHYVG